MIEFLSLYIVFEEILLILSFTCSHGLLLKAGNYSTMFTHFLPLYIKGALHPA